MVKIKEGYLMSATERITYEQDNARPTKSSGRVDYYFKPETKYPPRIYVFMHAELWCDRNRRPMGLFSAFSFLSRPINKEEIEYHHFDTRLCYHQYEAWEPLLSAEEKEAAELDKESSGTGAKFLTLLRSFRSTYHLQNKSKPPLPAPKANWAVDSFARIDLNLPEDKLLENLIHLGNSVSNHDLAESMREERKGQNRKPITVALQRLFLNTALGEPEKKPLVLKLIYRKAELALIRTRKNFVRRIWKQNPLFAIQEIRLRYPDYHEEMLDEDLKVKARTPKRKKRKPIVDLRRCQLFKLAARLQTTGISETDYHQVCCRIVMLQNAHRYRLPVSLAVKLEGVSAIYAFDWETREIVIKSFVSLANTQGMTHGQLEARYKEITSNTYNF